MSSWITWRREYHANLRECDQRRHRRANNSIDPKRDDVGLVHDEKLKRSEWKIGRIVKLLLSKDGICRAAEFIDISNGKTGYVGETYK